MKAGIIRFLRFIGIDVFLFGFFEKLLLALVKKLTFSLARRILKGLYDSRRRACKSASFDISPNILGVPYLKLPEP